MAAVEPREYVILPPTVTIACGLCSRQVYQETQLEIPRREAMMAALVQHFLREHQHACPYCWHYVPSDEEPVRHRRECAYEFERRWRP